MTAPRGSSAVASKQRASQLALGADFTTAVSHPSLSSAAEVALDAVLAASVREWDVRHAHDVPLHALLPGRDVRPFDVDLSLATVLVRDGDVLGVIDVGHGSALSDDEHGARRVIARRMLEGAGLAVHACDLPAGPYALTALCDAAGWVVARFGRGAVPTVEGARSLVIEAGADVMLRFTLFQMTLLLCRWQQQLGAPDLTLEGYAERRADMCESDHPLAISLPDEAALQRMLHDAGITLEVLTGRAAVRREQGVV